jgi:protein-tyrosine phosphatase
MAALLDVDTSAFRAHQLTQDDALGADLVLTMTRAQRAVVVSLAPAALRRTFTLREFADLVGLCVTERPAPGGSAADRLAHLTAVAPRARSRRSAGVADDIDDPYGKDAAAHRRAVAEIADAVTRIAAATTPAAG